MTEPRAKVIYMANIKKLTLLHSNDMHGDFLAENVDANLIGGVSMLSGYINKVRQEEKNVIYAIAGDMFRGSIIDSEYQGISTIEIMNLLGPDIVTLGNHEVDYGVAHLLFLEKCAEFPIINANLHIKTNNARLFEPCHIIQIDGMKILFIGILTESVLSQCKTDGIIGTFVNVEDAAMEVGRICNTYNAMDVDFTVLLTHIGFEEDKKLAELLDPSWGVDVIIGGHSHTFLTEPCVVNGIPIVQAGTGTDQIGRFDILIDTDTNSINSYTWAPIPINSENCPRDTAIEEVIGTYKARTDEKYGKIITKFVRQLTHPSRIRETELGDLFSDVLKESLGVDIFLLGSGSIRNEQLGPVVTKGDLRECFPYDDAVHVVYVTGGQLKQMLKRMMRDEVFEGAHCEFYQLSKGLVVEYDQSSHSYLRFEFEGEPVDDDRVFTVGLQHFHYLNIENTFGISIDELRKNHVDRVVATSCTQVIEEALQVGQHQNASGEGRLILHLNRDWAATKSGVRHRIIIDSDTAGDDAAAIILAAKSPSVEIVGVTVAAGNVTLEQAAANSMASLELAGCDAPVYLGATCPLSGEDKECFSVYGKDGMGEADLIHPKGKPQEKNAVDFILDTVSANPGEVEIVALGPVTNIAMAIMKDRETMMKVKRIWSMGTAGFGPGNATPVAEFNVYKDAPAYKIMLELGVPITVIGLDQDDDPTWSDEKKLDEMMNGNEIQRFISVAVRKLLEFKKGNGIPAVDLPDAVAMGCLVWPDYVEETTQCYGSCITDPGETYGMVVFYKDGFTYDSMPKIGKANISVVTKAKKTEFVDRLNAAFKS